MTDSPTDQALCGGVPFAPTPAEMAAADQSAEVARLRGLLARWLRAADTGLWRDGVGLSLAATMVADDARAALAAPAAPPVESAEVARLREALRDALREMHYLTQQLAARGLPGVPGDTVDRVMDAARAALAAPAAQDDRSAPEDRERWLAEWMRKQREADDAAG